MSQRFLLITGLERDCPSNELLAEAEAWCTPHEVETTETILGLDVGGNLRIIKHDEHPVGRLVGRAVDVS